MYIFFIDPGSEKIYIKKVTNIKVNTPQLPAYNSEMSFRVCKNQKKFIKLQIMPGCSVYFHMKISK